MNVSVAKQVGDERDKRQRKPEKRTVLDIGSAKRFSAKFVCVSVPDYISADWTKVAAVDVAVVGEGLAMVAAALHGPRRAIAGEVEQEHA